MDVITMQPITSLITKLSADFPELTFASGDEFRWLPEASTILYVPDSHDLPSLLHEVAHALLHHTSYAKDVELLKVESDAWQYTAVHLGPAYQVDIAEEVIESALDTYRDWLHARASCPNCEAVGIESRRGVYKCLGCHIQWQANDARICGLRRYILTK